MSQEREFWGPEYWEGKTKKALKMSLEVPLQNLEESYRKLIREYKKMISDLQEQRRGLSKLSYNELKASFESGVVEDLYENIKAIDEAEKKKLEKLVQEKKLVESQVSLDKIKKAKAAGFNLEIDKDL